MTDNPTPNAAQFAAPISEQIWDMKYRFKDPKGEPIDVTVEDTWSRIAGALAAPEAEYADCPVDGKIKAGRKAVASAKDQFIDALSDWKFVPAGRIVAGAGTGRMVTMFNCFVMGTIPDSMDGIFSMLREAALTMQQGGGIGYDFSPIRPKTSLVKKLGADASGPLSFMDCWDAMCRTVMSAGSRRGAMMATMRCDHPDIEDYITAKQDAAKLRMFNLSVLATDRFMEAVEENEDWPLCHVEPPAEGFGEKPVIVDHEGVHAVHGPGQPRYLHKTVKARDLWNLIMQSTYDAAEPGVIFIDRINKANNLNYCETISSTNPCGEQPLPPYGACLLGSINLAKFVRDPFGAEPYIDKSELGRTVRTAIRMMDNVVDASNFPLEAQREEAKAKRRLGLGVTGLADALVMMGRVYGTEEAAELTESILKLIALDAYWASVNLAKEKGAFPLFDADKFLAEGTHASELVKLDPRLGEAIREHGIRNSHLTSIAPTGTISLYAGNVSSGIEPIFAYGYDRKVLLPDGTHMIERVEDYAVAAYRKHYNKNRTRPDDFDPDVHLTETFVTAQTLSPEDHVRMQAAAQKWVDSSISKTVNLPEDISFEAFKAVYWDAYDQGCKGCTTYRPNDITGSVLSVDEAPEEEPELIAFENDAEFVVEVQGVHDRNVAGHGDVARKHWYDTKERYGILESESVTAVDPVDRSQFIADLTMSTAEVEIETELDTMIAAARGHMMTEEESTAQARSFAAANLKIDRDEAKITPEVTEAAKRLGIHAADLASVIDFETASTKPAEELPERPDELRGSTYKIKVGNQKAVYLTVNDTTESDGSARPFEIFLRSSDPTHDEWMVAIARTVSAVMRRPYGARFIAEDFKRIQSPITGGFQRGGGFQPSILAAIGSKLIEHMDRTEAMTQPQRMVYMSTPRSWGKTTDWVLQMFETGPNIEFTSTGVAWPEDANTSGGVAEGSGLQENEVPVQASAPGPMCSNCSSFNVKVEGGCPTCLDCGYSKCG